MFKSAAEIARFVFNFEFPKENLHDKRRKGDVAENRNERIERQIRAQKSAFIFSFYKYTVRIGRRHDKIQDGTEAIQRI